MLKFKNWLEHTCGVRKEYVVSILPHCDPSVLNVKSIIKLKGGSEYKSSETTDTLIDRMNGVYHE